MSVVKPALTRTRFSRMMGGSLLSVALAALITVSIPGKTIAQPSDIQEQWNGTWVMTEETTMYVYLDCCEGPAAHIPLTPKYRKIRDDFAAIPFTAPEKTVGNLPKCITPGSPGLFQHPLLFDFSWSPGRVNIVYQDGSYRRIWTDGRTFEEDLISTPQGTSIGHWEGNTLVVETRGISTQSEMFLSAPINTSRQTKVIERLTVKHEKVKTGKTVSDRVLHVQMTLEDPAVFTEPYTFDMTFIVVPISFETGCAANNRDDGFSFDLTPPIDD